MKFTEDEQQAHSYLMRAILEEINSRGLPSYLKGGTSLMFCYGLDRFSEDIDLNSEKSFNLKSIITKAAKSPQIELKDIKLVKDTDTTKRYKVFYNDKTLKIETSLRDTIKQEEITIIDNIRVYKLKPLIEMKINAFINRDTARDFHDVSFLIDKHIYKLTSKQKDTLLDLWNNKPDKILEFEEIYKQDTLLTQRYNSDFDKFEKAMNVLQKQRGESIRIS